jgi:protoheme IX farnesyltransferase
LRMVSVADSSGRKTAWHALISALILFPVSLLPVWAGFASFFYGACAVILSALFVRAGIRFVQRPERPQARALFLYSIIYLPVLLAMLALDIPIRGFFR